MIKRTRNKKKQGVRRNKGVRAIENGLKDSNAGRIKSVSEIRGKYGLSE